MNPEKSAIQISSPTDTMTQTNITTKPTRLPNVHSWEGRDGTEILNRE